MDVERFDTSKAGEAVRRVSGASFADTGSAKGANMDERMARRARQCISPMCRVAPMSTFLNTVLKEIAIERPVGI